MPGTQTAWLGDVPSPASCAMPGVGSPPQHRVPCRVLGPLPSWVLGPLLGTVCHARCWVPSPARGWSSGHPWGQWGLSPTAPWWPQLCDVPSAPWDRSLVLSPGVEAQRPVEPRSSGSSHLAGVGITQEVSPLVGVTAGWGDAEPVQGLLWSSRTALGRRKASGPQARALPHPWSGSGSWGHL